MLSLPKGDPATSYRTSVSEREDTPEPSTSATPQIKVLPRSFVSPGKSTSKAPFINSKGKSKQDTADDFSRHSDDALDDLLHRCEDTISTIGSQAVSYAALTRRLEKIKHEIALRVERRKLEHTHLEQPPASVNDTDMAPTMREGLRKSQALSQPLKQSTSRMKPMSYEDSLALQTISAAREKEQAIKLQHASIAQAKHYMPETDTRKNAFSYHVNSDGEEDTFDPLEQSGLVDFDSEEELDERDLELLNGFGLAVGEEDRDR